MIKVERLADRTERVIKDSITVGSKEIIIETYIVNRKLNRVEIKDKDYQDVVVIYSEALPHVLKVLNNIAIEFINHEEV